MNRIMLSVGAATCVITPGLPFSLAGHPSPRLAARVADELQARIICLQDGRSTVALMGLDLIWLGAEQVAVVRAAVGAALSTTLDAVLVACTHTHSGPDVSGWYADGITPEPAWIRRVARRAARAATAALASVQPVETWHGTATVDVAVNRRLLVDGRIARLPNPDGPVDRVVRLLSFVGAHGHVASLVLASLHPVLLPRDGTDVSAEWCGAAARYLDRTLGGTSVVLNCAPGDNNPAAWTDRSYAEMVTVGEKIGAAALAAQRTARRLDASGLRARSARLTVASRPHPYLTRWQSDRTARDGGILTEVQVVRIGGVSFCALPGECLVETANALAPLVPISYANDYIGYLPLAHIFAQGGYESSATMTDEDGVATLLRAVRELSAGMS